LLLKIAVKSDCTTTEQTRRIWGRDFSLAAQI
jgi:hypothetical protein